MSDAFDRRQFLVASGSALAAIWLPRTPEMFAIAAESAARAGTPIAQTSWDVFTVAQAETFDAFASRIIPTDDLPGAREAGAVYFIDRAMKGWAGEMKPPMLGLVASLDAAAAKLPGAPRFSVLNDTQQDAIVAELEKSAPELFGAGQFAVVIGTFANPEYGGNRDLAGWKILGFESRMQWSKPYGYYDRPEVLKNAH
jgi:gluconate 2-dehydrogenase gamma chain